MAAIFGSVGGPYYTLFALFVTARAVFGKNNYVCDFDLWRLYLAVLVGPVDILHILSNTIHLVLVRSTGTRYMIAGIVFTMPVFFFSPFFAHFSGEGDPGVGGSRANLHRSDGQGPRQAVL